jgi:hypothetical protein
MSKRRLPDPPWTFPIAVTDVPETGKRVELSPDSATRVAIANLAGLAGLPRLEAQFDLTRHGREGLRVIGRVAATVEQNCVVTLEPVQDDIDEAVDLTFMPSPRPVEPGAIEQIHTLEENEQSQTLDNGTLDVGALAMEFLLLGINPYPRKAGVIFDAPSFGDPEARPFAALAALKKDLGGKP